MRSDACCDERARWYSDSVVFSWFLTCHDCTRIIHNGSQCVLLIVSHWFWLFLCFWYYFWPSIFIAFQLQAWFAWSEVSCQMRQGCRIHHWPGRPQFQLPVLIRSKHVVPCLNTNTGHLKFSLVLHNFCAIYGKSFCGNTDCNSFELPTQSVVRSWFPTWRTSLHNFACNALCAWALGLEDCTWQQIHNVDNAQNTNCQRHRCLDCMIHSLQGHCLVIFHVVSLFQRNRVPRFALSSWAVGTFVWRCPFRGNVPRLCHESAWIVCGTVISRMILETISFEGWLRYWKKATAQVLREQIFQEASFGQIYYDRHLWQFLCRLLHFHHQAVLCLFLAVYLHFLWLKHTETD